MSGYRYGATQRDPGRDHSSVLTGWHGVAASDLPEPPPAGQDPEPECDDFVTGRTPRSSRVIRAKIIPDPVDLIKELTVDCPNCGEDLALCDCPDVAEHHFPPVPPALLDALDHLDRDDPILAALAVLDAKLAVLIADQERLLRLLERVAGVVDVRLVTS